MTEYGRGYGSEPWHPEDPLYGDQGSYGGQPQQSQWGGQEPAPQQRYDGGEYGGQATYDTYGGQQPAVPYGATGHAYYGGQDGYPAPQHGVQGDPGYQGYPEHQGPQGHPGQQGQDHSGHQGHPQEHPGVPAQQSYQGHQDHQDPPGHPGLQQPHAPQHHQQTPYSDPQHGEVAGDDWRVAPDHDQVPRPRAAEPDHPFFAPDAEGPGRDEDEAADPREGRRAARERRDKRNKRNKRHSGRACLIVSVLLVGTVGGVGYFGYDFLQSRFGSAPDFEGAGSGAVQIEIPQGAPVQQMGQILKREGVVKSVDAFTDAVADNAKAKSLQAGTYSLRKKMSAAEAVTLMLDPKSRNGLTVREGLRAGAVYQLIDKKLKLAAGTTKKVAKSQVKNLGLPSWAGDSAQIKDPLEGFLYPSTYSVGKEAKPADVLKEMVSRATQEYEKYDLEKNAAKLHLKSPMELLTVASLTQAEGKYKHDFEKVATVVYNRLKPDNTETYGLLDFDSTVNYARVESTLDTGAVDDLRQFNDPYNTYKFKGLPPGPIGNPGAEAIEAAIHPVKGNWYYFVSINPEKTLFAETNEEHERNRKLYEKEREKGN